MISRLFVIILGCFLLMVLHSCEQEKKPLNVLLFTADDLDKHSLGCYGGNLEDISPNIDRLSSEGLTFNHAYVNNSICAPSRGILATGLYGHNSGIMGFMKMSSACETPLIMEVLRDHGYQVGILSKVDHSTPRESFKWDFVYTKQDLGNGRNPELYFQRAKEFFEKARESDRPFYFMVNSDDPHRPFFIPGQELTKGMLSPSRIYTPEEVEVPGFLPDLPDVRREISYYFNSVKRLDDTFGKVMLALEESGFKDNTLVVFMSDNGIAVPFAKCDNYFASSRTPWIVRWPGITKPGTRNNENLISGVDFYPTIIEAAGIKPVANLDGVSRLPLYKGGEQKSDEYIFTQIDHKHSGKKMPLRSNASPMRGIQNKDYIYIYNAWSYSDAIYYNNNEGITMQAMENAAVKDETIAERVNNFRKRPIEEFYDLRNDSDCINNLIDNEHYFEEIEKMKVALKDWMLTSGDPLFSVFETDDSPEQVRKKLYTLYPELSLVDQSVTK